MSGPINRSIRGGNFGYSGSNFPAAGHNYKSPDTTGCVRAYMYIK